MFTLTFIEKKANLNKKNFCDSILYDKYGENGKALIIPCQLYLLLPLERTDENKIIYIQKKKKNRNYDVID